MKQKEDEKQWTSRYWILTKNKVNNITVNTDKQGYLYYSGAAELD